MITYLLILSNTVFGVACALLIWKNGLLRIELRKAKSDCQMWQDSYIKRVNETLTESEKELQNAFSVIVKQWIARRKF